MSINWAVSPEDAELIKQIADRGVIMAKGADIDYDFQTIEMDLTAAHANGCPLDLDRFLNADDANFGHDLFGIRRYIDRNTGIIPGNKFWPRMGKHDKEVSENA
jgi:hypothetical protein